MKPKALLLALTATAVPFITACVPPATAGAPAPRTSWGPGTYTVGWGGDIPVGRYMSEPDGVIDDVTIEGLEAQLSGHAADRLIVDLLADDETITVNAGSIMLWAPRPFVPNTLLDGWYQANEVSALPPPPNDFPVQSYNITAGPDGHAYWATWSWTRRYLDPVDWDWNEGSGEPVSPLLVTGCCFIEVYGVWVP